MLLPTLTKRTAPLFAKSLRTTIPAQNISLATANAKQIPQYNTLKASLLTAVAGLWGYNKIDSLTVHAQEEQLKYSKEMKDLFQQFKDHLQTNNTTGAATALRNMTNRLKEDGDCKILAYSTNQYLMAAKALMIKEAIESPKNQIESLLNIHICFVVMANGSMKNIEKNGYHIKFPDASADVFEEIRKHKETRQNFLEIIEKMESESNKNEVFKEITKTMKKLLVDGLPQTA
jgi:hypothetical protein